MFFSPKLTRGQTAHVHPSGLFKGVKKRGLNDFDATLRSALQTITKSVPRSAHHAFAELANA